MYLRIASGRFMPQPWRTTRMEDEYSSAAKNYCALTWEGILHFCKCGNSRGSLPLHAQYCHNRGSVHLYGVAFTSCVIYHHNLSSIEIIFDIKKIVDKHKAKFCLRLSPSFSLTFVFFVLSSTKTILPNFAESLSVCSPVCLNVAQKQLSRFS